MIIWAALELVGILLAALITLIFVILIIPFGIEVKATKYAETRVESRLLLANFGIYSFTIWPSRRSSKTKAKKPKKARRRPKDRKADGASAAGRILSTLSIDLVPQVFILLRRLLKSLRLRIMANGKFGAADPAATGMLFGAYQSIARPLNVPGVIQPCFDRACLEGQAEIKGRIWPVQLIADALLFVFSKPVRRVWFPELKYRLSRR